MKNKYRRIAIPDWMIFINYYSKLKKIWHPSPYEGRITADKKASLCFARITSQSL